MTLKEVVTGQISLAGLEWRPLAKKVLIVAAAGGCVALVLEPDHTSGLPVLAAFGLWFSHIVIAAFLFLAALAGLLHLQLREPLPVAAATLLLPIIFAPVSLLLDYGFGKPDEELKTGLEPFAIYFAEIGAVAPVTVIIALIVSVMIYREAMPDDQPGETAQAPALASLIDTVPRSLGDDVIRLHAQDHYVEVVTSAGSALLTERFSDCVEKLKPLEGIQCHRSHWISLDHVVELTRSGSAYSCSMSNGDRVPVGRRRYSELKALLET